MIHKNNKNNNNNNNNQGVFLELLVAANKRYGIISENDEDNDFILSGNDVTVFTVGMKQ